MTFFLQKNSSPIPTILVGAWNAVSHPSMRKKYMRTVIVKNSRLFNFCCLCKKDIKSINGSAFNCEPTIEIPMKKSSVFIPLTFVRDPLVRESGNQKPDDFVETFRTYLVHHQSRKLSER